ncbi:MAG: hypothetical protein HYV18_06620 [Gammaproteobacteria bacterium]|nr:hypothetical protein [Gammaproteobacteria bacterium]
MTGDARRDLVRLLQLLSRENRHLLDVRRRLFGPPPATITPAWLESIVSSPEGIDRLESFGAKFSRMQDTLVDKLLPTVVAAYRFTDALGSTYERIDARAREWGLQA